MQSPSQLHTPAQSSTEAQPIRKDLAIIADLIATHYDLGEVGAPHPMPRAHQRRHRKLVVDTQAGDFLVKTYRNDPVVIDALHFQHRLSQHLLSHGLPVAPIQAARNGKQLVVVDDWVMELQRFMPGSPMLVTTPTLIAAAEALAQFHVVCEGFPAPPRDRRKWRFSEVPFSAFHQLFETAQAIRDDSQLQKDCDFIAMFLQDAHEALREEKRNQLDTGLIHGDWHTGNLLFEGERLSAVLDLEFAGDGCYLEDIAYAISNLCIRTTKDTEKMQLRTNIVIDHYQYARSLSIYETLALYYAVGVKHVTAVAYQIQQHGHIAGYDAANWMERLATQCKWLERQAKKIRFGF